MVAGACRASAGRLAAPPRRAARRSRPCCGGYARSVCAAALAGTRAGGGGGGGGGGAATVRLVEAAVLAAATGLAFHLSAAARADAYFGALFPLPPVLAARRHGWRGAAHTLAATALLLLVLGGPLRAVSYTLLHGVVGLSLGAAWARGLPWAASVPLSAAARTCGILASLQCSSWLLREDLVRLALAQVGNSLDQLLANVGAGGAPAQGLLAAFLLGLLALNSLMYVTLLHTLYALVLRRLPGDPAAFCEPPQWLARRLFR